MRTYLIIVYVATGEDLFPRKTIEARNYYEAEAAAMRWAHQLSNYGEGPHLFGWHVEHVKKGARKK